MTINLRSVEETHERMFRVHNLLTEGARHLHEILTDLTGAARYNEDRNKVSHIIEALARARDLSDEAWKAAATARTALIRETGCDGSCSKSH
jgi:hypothetical protein